MKTKLVYSVVSNENDYYLEQAYISMSSARHHMPDVHIVLVIDKATSDHLAGFRKVETEIADEMIVVDLDPCLSAKKRSRLLKTSLRNVVDGDFLYVDGDTLIVSDLSDVDSFNFQIGAVKDRHVGMKSHPFSSIILTDLAKLGVDTPDVYFNSGVLLVKDNYETRQFFKSWKENYIKGLGKGVSQDQPSFAETRCSHDIVSELGDEWNCQMCSGIRYMYKAKVCHYFSSNSNICILNDAETLARIRQKESIPDTIQGLFVNPFLGIKEDNTIICGDDLNFHFTPQYKSIKSLLMSRSCVGKVIELIIRLNESYCRLKYNIFHSKRGNE